MKLNESLGILMYILLLFNRKFFVLSDESSTEESGPSVPDPLFIDEMLDGIRKMFTNDSVEDSLPTADDVKFLVYNPNNETDHDQWEKIEEENTARLLRPNKPFKITIHGFLSSCNDSYMLKDIFDEYAKRDSEINMICVDWSVLSNPVETITALLHYPKAVNYTVFVGETLERFIEDLMKTGYINTTSDVHLIGFSLGSHISGSCGHLLYKRLKVKLGRITGLDPAGPYFYMKDSGSKVKLGRSHADFVDVIYSNIGQLGVGANDTNLGHVGFLPNGGDTQPMCENNDFLLRVVESFTGVCSHQAAKALFAKSINTKIPTCKCKSWNEFKKMKNGCKDKDVELLGDQVSFKARGKYCLEVDTL